MVGRAELLNGRAYLFEAIGIHVIPPESCSAETLSASIDRNSNDMFFQGSLNWP